MARADAEGRKYPNAIRRTDQLSAIYNCHGLTFAARRTGISAATEVIKILSDDEYTEITESAVQPGDIVVWYNDENGDVEHSAIVLERPPPLAGLRQPLRVISKWGDAYEYIHALQDCPYVEHQAKRYYRINK